MKNSTISWRQKDKSAMMAFSKIISVLANGTGKAAESSSSGSGNSVANWIANTLVGFFTKLGDMLLNWFMTIFIYVVQFMLRIVDFLQFFVGKLAGIDTWTSKGDAGSVRLADTDVIFRFLLSDSVVKALLAIAGFSVVLLIIFTIIAIVKTDYDAAVDSDGKADGNKMKVLKKTGQSLFVMFIVPVILVFGILGSNAILASLSNALKQNNSISLGGQIFSASSYEANRYRQYADGNTRVPVEFADEALSAVYNPTKGYDALGGLVNVGSDGDSDVLFVAPKGYSKMNSALGAGGTALGVSSNTQSCYFYEIVDNLSGVWNGWEYDSTEKCVKNNGAKIDALKLDHTYYIKAGNLTFSKVQVGSGLVSTLAGGNSYGWTNIAYSFDDIFYNVYWSTNHDNTNPPKSTTWIYGGSGVQSVTNFNGSGYFSMEYYTSGGVAGTLIDIGNAVGEALGLGSVTKPTGIGDKHFTLLPELTINGEQQVWYKSSQYGGVPISLYSLGYMDATLAGSLSTGGFDTNIIRAVYRSWTYNSRILKDNDWGTKTYYGKKFDNSVKVKTEDIPTIGTSDKRKVSVFSNADDWYFDQKFVPIQDEYYVMADFVDWALGYGIEFYFVDSGNPLIKWNADANKGITSQVDTKYLTGAIDSVTGFVVEYNSGINRYYETVRGNSELDGTIFICCRKVGEYYVPITQAETRSSGFVSSYLAPDYRGPIVARGIFDEDGNPTFISKDNSSTNEIAYYKIAAADDANSGNSAIYKESGTDKDNIEGEYNVYQPAKGTLSPIRTNGDPVVGASSISFDHVKVDEIWIENDVQYITLHFYHAIKEKTIINSADYYTTDSNFDYLFTAHVIGWQGNDGYWYSNLFAATTTFTVGGKNYSAAPASNLLTNTINYIYFGRDSISRVFTIDFGFGTNGLTSLFDAQAQSSLFYFRAYANFRYAYASGLSDTLYHLTNGSAYLDYNFSKSDGIAMTYLYRPGSLNIIILLFATVLIFTVLGQAVWGLIARIYEITLMFIIYPGLVSTIPLDGGSRFKKWRETMVKKVLGAYGVILGINIFFILLPVVKDSTAIFRKEDIPSTLAGSGVFGNADFLNQITYILFLLVLFTLIKTLPKLIADMIGADDVYTSGAQVKKDAIDNVKAVGDVVSGKKVLQAASSAKDTLKGFIPGKAILDVPLKWGKDVVKNAGKNFVDKKRTEHAEKKQLTDADKQQQKELKKQRKELERLGKHDEAQMLKKQEVQHKANIKTLNKQYNKANHFNAAQMLLTTFGGKKGADAVQRFKQKRIQNYAVKQIEKAEDSLKKYEGKANRRADKLKKKIDEGKITEADLIAREDARRDVVDAFGKVGRGAGKVIKAPFRAFNAVRNGIANAGQRMENVSQTLSGYDARSNIDGHINSYDKTRIHKAIVEWNSLKQDTGRDIDDLRTIMGDISHGTKSGTGWRTDGTNISFLNPDGSVMNSLVVESVNERLKNVDTVNSRFGTMRGKTAVERNKKMYKLGMDVSDPSSPVVGLGIVPGGSAGSGGPAAGAAPSGSAGSGSPAAGAAPSGSAGSGSPAAGGAPGGPAGSSGPAAGTGYKQEYQVPDELRRMADEALARQHEEFTKNRESADKNDGNGNNVSTTPTSTSDMSQMNPMFKRMDDESKIVNNKFKELLGLDRAIENTNKNSQAARIARDDTSFKLEQALQSYRLDNNIKNLNKVRSDFEDDYKEQGVGDKFFDAVNKKNVEIQQNNIKHLNELYDKLSEQKKSGQELDLSKVLSEIKQLEENKNKISKDTLLEEIKKELKTNNEVKKASDNNLGNILQRNKDKGMGNSTHSNGDDDEV